MPELRTLGPDDADPVAELYNNAFRLGMVTARGWSQNLTYGVSLGLAEPGRVASIVRILPYTIWVGGQEMAMGGIGGVATWADCQGKGYAGRLMTESVKVMRDQGQCVSALYPFSHRYYRKFGWETVGERRILSEFSQTDMNRYEELALVRAYRGEGDIPRLDSAYREFAVRMNGMAVRPTENWQRRLNALDEKRGQAYLIEDQGKSIGYFFCENHPVTPYTYESRTVEFACVGAKAYRAMIGFFSALPPNVKTFTLFAPPYPPLTDYFKEPFFPIKCQPSFQFRVVDVEKAVTSRGFEPAVRGRLMVEIQDEIGQWNTGLWALEFSDGHCAIRRASSGVADFSFSIQQFSRLFVGGADPLALAHQGLFPSGSAESLRLLRDAFRDRPVYLADAF